MKSSAGIKLDLSLLSISGWPKHRNSSSMDEYFSEDDDDYESHSPVVPAAAATAPAAAGKSIPLVSVSQVKAGDIVLIGCNKINSPDYVMGGSRTCRSYIKNLLLSVPRENPEYDIDLSLINIVDIGDVGILPSIEDNSWPLERVVSMVLEIGAFPIIIDGDNSVSRGSSNFAGFTPDVAPGYAAACGFMSANPSPRGDTFSHSHLNPITTEESFRLADYFRNICVLSVSSRVGGMHLQVSCHWKRKIYEFFDLFLGHEDNFFLNFLLFWILFSAFTQRNILQTNFF